MKKITLLILLALVTFSCSSEQEKQEQKRIEQRKKLIERHEQIKETMLKGVELSPEELEAEKEFGF